MDARHLLGETLTQAFFKVIDVYPTGIFELNLEYGLLRTADSVTPSLSGADVALSLAGYMIVYLIMYPAGGLMMMKLVNRGPAAQHDDAVESGRRRHPVDALPQAERGGEQAS